MIATAPADDGPGGDQVVKLLQSLGLTQLAEHWPELLKRATAKQVDYTEFVGKLLEWEITARGARRRERCLKRAKLGAVEGLEGFDFTIRPKLEPRVLKELLRCAWASDGRPILCLGRPGTGKTRIAKALGQAAVDQGLAVLYVGHTLDMLDALRGARVDGTYKRVFRRYTKPDVLILDEFGYEAFDAQATDDLFRVVADRHERSSTVVVANTSFKTWHRFFPSKSHAVATVDRLVDRATILRFTGASRRKPKDVHGEALPDEGAE